MKQLTRRGFGKALTVAGFTTALTSIQKAGPNDRVRLGFVGLGNRGDQVLDGFLEQRDAEVVAICDLYQPYLDFACKKIGTNPRQFKDYRRLLDIHEIDAVVICTPDHWHALQTIHACQAGKDVYVEKPLSLRVDEGRRMVEAARRYSRVTQVGLMRRSSPFCKEAVELIRRGEIGKVSSIRCFHIENEWPKGIGNPPDEGPPEDLDWDAWLGPAPQVPYNRNRAFYRFRWFYDYSGGQVTNFGAHFVDFVHWTLGLDAPLAVTGMGAKLAVEDNREIPDTLEVLWTYPGGTLVTFSQFNSNGAPADRRGSNIEVRGTKGTLYLTWDGYEVVPEEVTDEELPARGPLHRASDSNYGKNRKAEIPRTRCHDRDSIYGGPFRQRVTEIGIREVLTAPRSPWQSPYVERLIGSIRRECLDHVMVLNEAALRRTLKSYFRYYGRSRTHLSLAKHAPEARVVQPPELGPLIELAEVGGLHHRYERRAA